MLELVAYGLVAIGFLLMTLGIFEIGGLFNLVLGFAIICIGCVGLFAREGRRGLAEEEERFMRELRDM